jgi:hypothetical protein
MYQDSLYGHIHLWMAVGPSACWFSPGDNHSLQFHHTPQDTDHLLIVTIQKRDFSSLMKTALHYASTVIFKSELFPELPSDPVLSDKLGYCTWNAFGTENLCLDNLLLALDSLQQADIPIDYLLLDDGWQEIQDSMLSSFDAIKSKFPGCLKHTVEVLKGKYPSLKHIGVWHVSYTLVYSIEYLLFNSLSFIGFMGLLERNR